MRGDSLRYCLFYDEKENLIGFGIDCAPSDGMREVSREEYFNITGDPRAAKEPVEVARAAKVAEISTACSAAIDAGTSVDLPSGSRESFTYTVADQANVSEMFTACLAGATGYIYHANDGPCKTYPVADIVAIYSTLSMYKTGQLTYHNQLKQYVLTLDNPEAVKAVTYGQALTGIYLEQYNTLMAEAQEQMQAVLSRLGGGSDAADG